MISLVTTDPAPITQPEIIFTGRIVELEPIKSLFPIDVLNHFFLFYENSNFFQIIFTTFCLIIVINSFNFIDGIDGLCSGLAIISLFFIICFSYFEIDTNSFLFLLIFFTCLNLFAFFGLRPPG